MSLRDYSYSVSTGSGQNSERLSLDDAVKVTKQMMVAYPRGHITIHPKGGWNDWRAMMKFKFFLGLVEIFEGNNEIRKETNTD